MLAQSLSLVSKSENSSNDDQDSDNDDEIDPVVDNYTFGKRMCKKGELLKKRILLSKNGQKVFFLKRDHARRVD